MSRRVQWRERFFGFLFAVVVTGCATAPYPTSEVSDVKQPSPGSVLRSLSIDSVLEDRILAIDPEGITDNDIRNTLAKGPTPRIVLLHGGVYPVHLVMVSFGEFLVGMGYPEEKIRDPANGEWSYSPYTTTQRLAGIVAWHYEHDGMRPMLIGHSQGGLYVVKILKELAGQYGDRVPVWNPAAATAEDRTTIIDPITGRERPVIGMSVAYASAVGAGGWALVLPNQWENLDNLRRIPDTVDEFTGYFIDVDFFALSFPGNPLDKRYENHGTANVRNVVLPAAYNHVMVPLTQALARDPQVRNWINDYRPGKSADPSALPGDAALHVLWAADVWYSIKKHWCLEAQRLIRAKRAALAQN